MLSKNEFKVLRSLHQKKYRLRLNRFLAEGLRLVEEGMKAGRVEKVLHTPRALEADRPLTLLTEARGQAIPVEEISEKDMESLSDTVHSQGIMAVATIPESRSSVQENCLYLQQIHDPGNLGTILRTADWFGVMHVALSPATVDPYNSKVVRGAMGSHFHLNIHTDCPLSQFREWGHTIIAGDPGGESSFQSLSSSFDPWCLVMGGEVHGLSEEVKKLSDHFISIPGAGEAESLNVAVAAGILLYELSKVS